MPVVLALTASLVIALFLIASGLRGVRTDDHPLCRGCGFDLIGRPGDSTRCPECGAELSPPAVVIGHRRRRRGRLAVGQLLAFASLTAIGADAAGWARDVDWLAHAPLWYLLREARSTDGARRSPALAEVTARYRRGRLSGSALDRVVDAGLDYQGDPREPWDPAWGNLIEAVHGRGGMSDDRWHRYAAQAWPGTFTLQVVNPVAPRGPFHFALQDVGGRVASRSALIITVDDPRLVWPEPDPPWQLDGFNEMRYRLDAQSSGPYWRLSAVRSAPDAPLGTHSLWLTAQVRIDPAGLGNPPPLATGQLTLVAKVTVVPDSD
jgi:hypothetical protein